MSALERPENLGGMKAISNDDNQCEELQEKNEFLLYCSINSGDIKRFKFSNQCFA